MSVENVQKKKLEEEVVVNESEATELVELDKEAKKAKVVSIAKKVGKVAGIAAVGLVGFLLGRGFGAKNDNNNSDVIDVDYEETTDEQ